MSANPLPPRSIITVSPHPSRARTTASGSRSMTVSRTRAARSGTRRPCSQSCTARASSPNRSANFLRLSFMRLRSATMCSAAGSSTIRQGSGVSPRKWCKHLAQGLLHLVSHLGSLSRHRFSSIFLIAATSRESTFLSAGAQVVPIRLRISGQQVDCLGLGLMEIDRADSAPLAPSRSSPAQLANPAGSSDYGRSSRIGDNGCLDGMSIRFRHELADSPFVRLGGEDTHRLKMAAVPQICQTRIQAT